MSRTPLVNGVVRRFDLLVVLGLTAVALALRAILLGDGLYGDELITYKDTAHGVDGVFDGISRYEANPPLFYLLAYGTRQLGGAASLIRLPSLVFGVALVPVVFALGRRTVGREAGLLAAALVAVSPFALYYSSEARGYETMTFFVALAALGLVRALEGGGLRWWIVYVGAATSALYTHYTSVFVIASLAVWGAWAHRARLRHVAAAQVVIALAYLPWLPSVLDQRQKDLFIAVIGQRVELTPRTFFEFAGRVLWSEPSRTFRPAFAWIGLGLLGAFVLLALARAARRAVERRRSGGPLASPGFVLVAVLALATPIGLTLYALLSADLYTPRNLASALPGLALALSGLVLSLERSPRIVAAAVLLGVVGLTGLFSLGASRRRPATPAVVAYIERTAAPRAPVVSGFGDVGALSIYLNHRHPLIQGEGVDRAAWRRPPGGSVFVVRSKVGSLPLMPRFGGPESRFLLRSVKKFPGLRTLAVGRYAGLVHARLVDSGGREVIAVRPGRDIAVRPGAVRGYVEKVAVAGGSAAVTGWGIASDHSAPADAVFAFLDGRLLGMTVPAIPRKDVASRYGDAVAACGFGFQAALTGDISHSPSKRLRVFAAAGGQASELPPLHKGGDLLTAVAGR